MVCKGIDLIYLFYKQANIFLQTNNYRNHFIPEITLNQA